MPRMVVRMKPDGSLSPGIINLAITPAMKPMMIVQRILHLNLPFSLNDALSKSRSGQTTIRGVFVDGRRQLARESREKLFLRKSRLLFELFEHVRSDCLLQLLRRDLFVWARIDPGLGCLRPFNLNRSSSSPMPPLSSPLAPAPPSISRRLPSNPPCDCEVPLEPGAAPPAALSSSANLSRF